MRNGGVALAGSDAVTCRITNQRLLNLGRRNTASNIPPGYVGEVSRGDALWMAYDFSLHAYQPSRS